MLTWRFLYSAHAAALVALAAQRNKEDLDFLFKTAKDDKLIGQHGMVRAGALKGTIVICDV